MINKFQDSKLFLRTTPICNQNALVVVLKITYVENDNLG